MVSVLIWLMCQASAQVTAKDLQQFANVSRCRFILAKGALQADQDAQLMALRALRPKLFASRTKRELYRAASAETTYLISEYLLLAAVIDTELAKVETVFRRELPGVELPPLNVDDCVMINLVYQGTDPQRKT